MTFIQSLKKIAIQRKIFWQQKVIIMLLYIITREDNDYNYDLYQTLA